MSAAELAAFRASQEALRLPLVVPTFLVTVLAMFSFLAWDIAREGRWGPGATVRVVGALAVLALLGLVHGVLKLPQRWQSLLLYVGMYAWQLAIGRTLGAESPIQFPGLLIIMFASILALTHAADARLNLVLAAISVPEVLPASPTLADWLFVLGLFGAVLLLVWLVCAQRERVLATSFLLQSQLELDAKTDSLTGLHNRRTFETVMQREISRSDRGSHRGIAPLSLAILDIDHFKSVNDRFGHDVGDAVLREIAARLRAKVRQVDLLARLGGEEFGLVMTDTRGADAAMLLERLRLAIEATPFETGGSMTAITISIGFAERSRADDGWEALYHRADRALYAAKAYGRNRVVED